eukprot:TRINITY_DN7648_c0_g1_i3.p1 TRINITY_DN7648_c0_g1~~TRINITY_DN7648_c0_g1_i3.p1  ORF type:complete len:191 (+),score=23.45 TRINITY_DN7648_c0_g1_i3:139-711(+)
MRWGLTKARVVVEMLPLYTLLVCVQLFLDSSYVALSLLPNGQPGFGTVCQRFYPKQFLGKRIKLTGHLCWNLVGPESWTGMWVKVDLITTNPRTFHLDNMADRKLVGSSEGSWVECEIVTDIPMNAEALSFGFLLVGMGIIWASDFKFEVVGNSVKPTGERGNQRTPADSVSQELRDNLRKLSLGPKQGQ